MKNLMKSLVVAGALFGGGLVGLGAATAMPIAPAAGGAQAATAPIETIGWRCGYGWHINPWGRCVPNRYYGYGYGYGRPYWRRHYYRPYYHRRYW
jgi:hypothetical protein